MELSGQPGSSTFASTVQVMPRTVASRVAGPSGGTGSSTGRRRTSPAASEKGPEISTGSRRSSCRAVTVRVETCPSASVVLSSCCQCSVATRATTTLRPAASCRAVSVIVPVARRPGSNRSRSRSSCQSMPWLEAVQLGLISSPPIGSMMAGVARPRGSPSYHRQTRLEAAVLPLETIRDAPKVLLHDHLDGGLRPATVVDLAAEFGYDGLPTSDVDDLAAWFRRGADRKSLELYLETFQHTVGVLQERDAIIRVAAECAEDLAADGVVYAEVRYAPELSTERGLTLDEVVEANLEGFRLGSARAAAAGHSIVIKVLVTAMRQAARSVEVADCAIRWRDAGVVGFDIAGPEAGYRPTRHLEAL